MSKNLTRKGLALGAVVALGSSLFAGTPATAAPTALYLDSAFGTSFEGVLGQNFVLSGTASGAADGDDVSYYIEGVTAANLTVVGRYTTALSTTTTGNVYSSAADSSGVAIKLVTTDKGTIALADTDAAAKVATVKVNTWQAGAALQFALKVNATNVTSTTSVKVTPFLDTTLADGIPGANELKGTPVTINFNKASELTATPTLKALTLGSAVKATVAVSKVNLEQFRAEADGAPAAQDFVNVDFSVNGTFGSSDDDFAPLWNKTDKEFVAATATTAAASSVYGARAQFGTTTSASAPILTAAAGEVASLGDITIAKGTSYRASATSSNVVRAGSGSISASTTITAESGKSKAGQKVTFVVAEQAANSLDSAATVTAGGKTLKNTSSTGDAETIEVDVLTDADGVATLAVTYAGIKDANKFDIKAKATAAAGAATGNGTSALTLTGRSSAAAGIVDLGASTGSSPVRQVAKGSAISVDYQVVDQFGQTPDGTFQVVFTNDASAGANERINHAATAPVTSGKVTFSGTDASTEDGSYSISAQVQKKDDSGNWGDVASISATSAIQIAAVSTPGSIALTVPTTEGVDRNLAALVAGNTALENSTVDRTVAGGADITAVVTGTDGAQADGVAVTFSAEGVLFSSGTVYGLGSITVLTNASGSTGAVRARSNKTGKVTVTITSGSVSKTQVLTFDTATSGGTAWASSAPAYVLPGRSLKVTGVLSDKYSAFVDTVLADEDVLVEYDGPGFLTSTPVKETDASGAVSANVLLGASDTGVAKFTFTYAGANGTIGETSSNDDIVKVVSVNIGTAPAASATAAVSGSKGKFYVSATAAAGKSVVVKVAGKFVTSFKATGSKKTVAVKATKGSKKVTVYVGGKLVATKTVTVK